MFESRKEFLKKLCRVSPYAIDIFGDKHKRKKKE